MSRAVPKSDDLDAQCLVTTGYRMQQPQRVYLVRLDKECTPETYVQALTDWETSCRLPPNVFERLLQGWLATGHRPNRLGQLVTDTRPSCQVDVAFTYPGLEKAGVQEHLLSVMRTKAPAFYQGAHQRAARQLGDTGPSDPRRWHTPYKADPANQLHVLLFVRSICASNVPLESGFRDFEMEVRNAIAETCNVCVVSTPSGLMASQWIEESTVLDPVHNRIHFGFIDGITSPVFEEHSPTAKRPAGSHQLGELLLGYLKDDGSNAWRNPKTSYQASDRISPARGNSNETGAFFKDGCFAALRKMEQDTQAFDTYLTGKASKIAGDPAYIKEWLKAKILGRWANGEPIKANQSPPTDRPVLPDETNRLKCEISSSKDIDAFTFGDDKQGYGCPYGAHIRRMNPRNDPVTPFVKRPLLRRGVPYGEENADQKGLLGLFLCSSLEEQFEHLLGSWADNNPIGMPYPAASKDPIIGNHEAQSSFFIPMPSGPAIELKKLPAFVITRGTSYVFFPSLGTLKAIGQTSNRQTQAATVR